MTLFPFLLAGSALFLLFPGADRLTAEEFTQDIVLRVNPAKKDADLDWFLDNPSLFIATQEEFISFLPLTSVPSDPLRHTWFFAGAYSQPAQLDAMFAECDLSVFADIHSAGYPFNVRVVSYTHVRTPNTRSCIASSQTTTLIHGPINPPTSKHPGGVNVLMCDGTVRFVNETINVGDLKATEPDKTTGASSYGVWGALGTMAGGETINDF